MGASNYEQLGLKFRLFSAEVLFNKGLSQIYMGRAQEGLADMEDARRDKATDEHNVIDDAIQDRGEGYTVFSIVSILQIFTITMDRTDCRLACWGPLSSFGKETEEFGHKRLHGEGGMCLMCRVNDYFLILLLETCRLK